MKKEKDGPEDKVFKKPIKSEIKSENKESDSEIKKNDDLEKIEKIIEGNTFLTQDENDPIIKLKNNSDNENVEEPKNEINENIINKETSNENKSKENSIIEESKEINEEGECYIELREKKEINFNIIQTNIIDIDKDKEKNETQENNINNVQENKEE